MKSTEIKTGNKMIEATREKVIFGLLMTLGIFTDYLFASDIFLMITIVIFWFAQHIFHNKTGEDQMQFGRRGRFGLVLGSLVVLRIILRLTR